MEGKGARESVCVLARGPGGCRMYQMLGVNPLVSLSFRGRYTTSMGMAVGIKWSAFHCFPVSRDHP